MPKHPVSPIHFEGNIARLVLPCGNVALIDADTAERANGLRWSLPKGRRVWRGVRHKTPRAWHPVLKRWVYLNRLAMNAPDGAQVWNMRGDYLDCRRSNLFLVDLRAFKEFCANLLTRCET